MRMTAFFGHGDGGRGRQHGGAIAAWILHSFSYSKCNVPCAPHLHLHMTCAHSLHLHMTCAHSLRTGARQRCTCIVLVILYLLYLCMVKTCVARNFFCLGIQVPRHSAGGVGSSYLRTYVHGTYRLQCPCTSNGSRELSHSYLYLYTWVQSIYSSDMVVQKWLLVLHMHMNILTRTVNT